MEQLNPVQPFGVAQIPPATASSLTANYKASEWEALRRHWKIAMYLSAPETGEPVDQPTTTLSFNADSNIKLKST